MLNLCHRLERAESSDYRFDWISIRKLGWEAQNNSAPFYGYTDYGAPVSVDGPAWDPMSDSDFIIQCYAGTLQSVGFTWFGTAGWGYFKYSSLPTFKSVTNLLAGLLFIKASSHTQWEAAQEQEYGKLWTRQFSWVEISNTGKEISQNVWEGTTSGIETALCDPLFY